MRSLCRLPAKSQLTVTRFETPPGQQSQIDWGQTRVRFRERHVVQHRFELTLGFSRRSFFCVFPNERLSEFLEAHECTSEHFGGHARENLYDRPRTVCHPSQSGRVKWSSTFKAFAEHWGFEPRLCRPYRAQPSAQTRAEHEAGGGT